MAWEPTDWACGHSGSMQLYGKGSGRDAQVARAAGRDCMACWLVGQWEKEKDPRAKREDRYKLAAQIAENKGIRIKVSDSIPVKEIAPVPENPLAKFTTTELMAEIDRRKTA